MATKDQIKTGQAFLDSVGAGSIAQAIGELLERTARAEDAAVERKLDAAIAAVRALQTREYVSALALFQPTEDLARYALRCGQWSQVGPGETPDNGLVAFRHDGVDFTVHGIHRDGHVMTEDEREAVYRASWAAMAKERKAKEEASAVATHQANDHVYEDPRDTRTHAERDADAVALAAGDVETFATPADAGAYDQVTVQDPPETVETYNPWAEAMAKYHSDDDGGPF